MPKIHPNYSNDAFLGRVIDRADARRRADRRKGYVGRPFVSRRGTSDLCYAYSVRTGEYYAGYSSIAGGMYGMDGFLGADNEHNKNLGNPKTIEDTNLPHRRLGRLVSALGDCAKSDPGKLGRAIANCAEACALSIALSYDENLEDLVFISFFPVAGPHKQTYRGLPHLKAPCGNCHSWLTRAFGYWENGFQFPEET